MFIRFFYLKPRMIINSYHTGSEFETREFRTSISFLRYLTFRIGSSQLPKRIVIIECERELLQDAKSICKYYSVQIDIRSEETKPYNFLIQKLCDESKSSSIKLLDHIRKRSNLASR